VDVVTFLTAEEKKIRLLLSAAEKNKRKEEGEKH